MRRILPGMTRPTNKRPENGSSKPRKRSADSKKSPEKGTFYFRHRKRITYCFPLVNPLLSKFYCHYLCKVYTLVGENIIHIPSDNELRRRSAIGDSVKMRLAAFDFRTFLFSQIILEQAAFGFHDEIQAFLPIFFHQHGPIRVVAAQWRRDGEPARQLGVDLDGFVLFQLVGKVRSVSESYTTARKPISWYPACSSDSRLAPPARTVPGRRIHHRPAAGT